jgi:TonB family protein
MPQYPGGEMNLLKYIAENTQYPSEAKEKGITGKVIVRMIVNKDGAVSNVEVIRGVDPLLDAEATRVVSSIPKFTPGKQGGVPVDVYYMVPINFALNKSSEVPAPVVEEIRAADKNTPSDFEPFVVVEEMPLYPGGEDAMLAYLAQNVRYPENAKKNKIQGKVIVRFCVTTSGGVDKVEVLRSVDPELDAEALRVVKTLNGFKPGMQGGKVVPVWYMVPIEYALK